MYEMHSVHLKLVIQIFKISIKNFSMALNLSLVLLLACVFSVSQTSGRILTKCEAVEELDKAKVGRSWISNYICIMEHESGFDTSKISPRAHKSSKAYGIFQITSDRSIAVFPDPVATAINDARTFWTMTWGMI